MDSLKRNTCTILPSSFFKTFWFRNGRLIIFSWVIFMNQKDCLIERYSYSRKECTVLWCKIRKMAWETGGSLQIDVIPSPLFSKLMCWSMGRNTCIYLLFEIFTLLYLFTALEDKVHCLAFRHFSCELGTVMSYLFNRW